MKPDELKKFKEDLANFGGTNEFHTHWIKPMKYTDGVKFVMDKANSYWLTDAVASWQKELREKKGVTDDTLQIWKLEVFVGSQGLLTCKDNDTGKELARQEIPFTDFPLSEITYYVMNNTIYLPSED